MPSISPSADWSGIPSSGFDGSYGATPPDPVRTTAKPVARLMVPPNQFFTDTLLVGVYAGANNSGSLLANMGLAKVVVHYEGNTLDIDEPSYATFDDVNGNSVTYFGWWITLRHNGTNGHANLYFEAVPADGTMQNRVIGPYQFSPQIVLHDLELQVAPSQPEVAGERYQSILNARAHIRQTGPENPRITITEPGIYDVAGSSFVPGSMALFGEGYCTIEASVPVTIGRASRAGGSADLMRPYWNGTRLKGANITLDMANVSQFNRETNASFGPRQTWLDGITVVDSAGRGNAWGGGPRSIVPISGNPWLTECVMSDLPNMGASASLARGCTFADGYSDVLTDVRCAVNNRISNHDSDDWAVDIPALSVSYVGGEATATLAASGGNDANTKTFTAKWGANSASKAFVKGTNDEFQDVADWLDGLGAGFTATVLDNTRRANSAALLGEKGVAFGDADVKSSALTVYSMFDLHNDIYQGLFGGENENVVLADNEGYDVVGQAVLLNASGGAKDVLIVNNAFAARMASGPYDTNANLFSQLANPESHVVIVHNSLASQGVALRTDQAYDPDSYCLFANNTVRSITWASAPNPGGTIVNNHLHSGSTIPATATGTTAGGSHLDLFAGAFGGDFTPAGDLLVNAKLPVVRFDRSGAQRGAAAPAGALA